MFLRFYDGENSRTQAKNFTDKVASLKKNVSPAQIQGYFMFHKNSHPEKVIENCEMIWKL